MNKKRKSWGGMRFFLETNFSKVRKRKKKMLEKDIGPEELEEKLKKFALVELKAPQISKLSENDRNALKKVIEAAKLLNPLRSPSSFSLTVLSLGSSSLFRLFRSKKKIRVKQK